MHRGSYGYDGDDEGDVVDDGGQYGQAKEEFLPSLVVVLEVGDPRRLPRGLHRHRHHYSSHNPPSRVWPLPHQSHRLLPEEI